MPEKTLSRLRTRDLTLVALFTALTAVCAWISVPVPAPFVQFTMQTFAVFATLLTLGGKRGTYAVTAYLLLGAVGAPVFTGFRGGLGVLLGTTGGYILGFLIQALLYWWMTARLGESLGVKVIASVLGLALCQDRNSHGADDRPGLLRVSLCASGPGQAGSGGAAVPAGGKVRPVTP